MESSARHGPGEESHSAGEDLMTGRRLFRALLRLLPFDFRADYGA